MNIRKNFSQALIVCAGLAIGTSAFAEAKCDAHPKAEQIPQKDFETALKKHGFDIKTFKVDGNCYEMYAKSKGGKKVEMYFDTKDGHIVKKEID